MRKFSKKIDFDTTDFDKLKISELKRIADYWLRKYLLKNAKRNNLNQVWCPIKERYYNEDKIQASHFIDRACLNLRYNTDNVHLLSEHSNMWDSKIMVEGYKSKHHKEFERYLGEDLVRYLLEESKKIRIFARRDYINTIEKFRDEQ